MQTSLASHLLLQMENLYVVSTLALLAIIARILYTRHRRQHPLPVVTKSETPQPHPAQLEVLEHMALAAIPAFIISMFIHQSGLYRLAIALASFAMLFVVIRLGAAAYHRRFPPAAPLPSARPKDFTLEVIDTIIIALVLVFGIVRPFLLQTFYIPSGSMEPTLLGPDLKNPIAAQRHGGDKLIANKFVLRFRAPRRGEVIVFDPPIQAIEGNNEIFMLRKWLQDPTNTMTARETALLARAFLPNEVMKAPETISDTDSTRNVAFMLAHLPQLPETREAFIKRVIAIPGDAVRVKNGKDVYINDKLILESYVPKGLPDIPKGDFPGIMYPPGKLPHLSSRLDRLNPTEQVESLREYLSDFQLWLMDWYRYDQLYKQRIEPRLEAGSFIVPDNSVFVMGDNRKEGGSFDSRYWGVVPFENIKARAVSTFWPPDRLKLL